MESIETQTIGVASVSTVPGVSSASGERDHLAIADILIAAEFVDDEATVVDSSEPKEDPVVRFPHQIARAPAVGDQWTVPPWNVW